MTFTNQTANSKSKDYSKEKTMINHSNEELFAPQLSRIRTLLFWALAFIWFSEMALWGFQSFSKVWTLVWGVIPPENTQLAVALTIIHAGEAPLKGALGVMAVFGLRSKNPFVRTALFASMALVPPLNIAFPFRADGFPLGPVAVATVFSAILWGSFFLFREPTQQPKQKGAIQLPPSRWEIFQYVWFAVNSAALTFMALLFLFWTRTALYFIFPSLSSLLNTSQGEISSLIRSGLATGTHLLALATASWLATIYCRRNSTLRQAMTAASTVYAGLFFLFPIRQLILEFGANRAISSILVTFALLLVGWVLYAAFSNRVELKKRQEIYI